MKAKLFWITAVLALLGAMHAEAAPMPVDTETPAAACGRHDPSAPGFYG